MKSEIDCGFGKTQMSADLNGDVGNDKDKEN